MHARTLPLAALLVAACALPGPSAAVDPKLDPGTAPAPTFKTLDQIPPTWDQMLPSDKRFVPVLGDVAYLDRETGLVWMTAPSTALFSWTEAQVHCMKRGGTRMGWRLPAIQELASLATQGDPKLGLSLVAGHPFTASMQTPWWSTTGSLSLPDYAWAIGVRVSGGIFPAFGIDVLPKGDRVASAWCVRGGAGSELQ